MGERVGERERGDGADVKFEGLACARQTRLQMIAITQKKHLASTLQEVFKGTENFYKFVILRLKHS